jgi:hydrogenase nickel incorporation protein HypA/HybF
MHELSIAAALLETIEEERVRHGFERVVRVRLRIGRYSNVVPEALVFGFEALAEGTAAAGAVLDFEHVPGRDDPLAGEDLDIVSLDVE